MKNFNPEFIYNRINKSPFKTNQSPTTFIPGRFTNVVTIILVSLFFYSTGFSQTSKPEDKIDPAFLQIMEPAVKNSRSAVSQLSHSSVKPVEGFAFKKGTVEKRYDCIVYTSNAQLLRDSGIIVNSALPTFVTAWVTLEQIKQMAAMKNVKYIKAPVTRQLHNDISVGNSGASLLQQGKLNNTMYKGKNVIIGIYDTGIDWDHLDFRDPKDSTKSRILRIWDQTLTAGPGEAPPAGFNYGVEYTQAQINNEIDGSPANFVREKDTFGHGTHVAGTAAGNGAAFSSNKYMGMAPEADLIIIKGGEKDFDVSKIINGLTYLDNVATALGRPVVLNLSLGNQVGAHDGTEPEEVAIDNFTNSAPGRVVVVSAGNDNGTNFHNRLILPASDKASVSFAVPDATASDVFEYDIFSSDNSNVSASITAPDGSIVTAVAGQRIGGLVLNNNFRVSIFNLTDPVSAKRYVKIYISQIAGNSMSAVGTWTLSLTNNSTNTLTMHGWLPYINPSFKKMVLAGGNSDYLVGSPGNATSAITVASFAARKNWYSKAYPGPFAFPDTRTDSISSFSSHGPRRDEVLKPEITANGEMVVSCLSSDASASTLSQQVVEPGLYVANRGTSMAAPCVTGAVALLLQAKPGASASEIKNLLTSTASKDIYTELQGGTTNSTWGYGRLDVFKAASSLFNCSQANRTSYQYDNAPAKIPDGAYGFATERVAVRFTPDISGKLGAVSFETSVYVSNMVIEVRASNAGTPGALLKTLNIDSTSLTKYSFNYVDLSGLNVPVTNGVDYFLILYRNSANNNPWSLFFRNSQNGNRSFISTTAGSSWYQILTDLRIRTIVYNNNGKSSGAIATTNSADTRDLNTSPQLVNSNCALIAQILPAGNNSVSGNITGKVWLEAEVPTALKGVPYVTRHYELAPEKEASGATGKVTLYFTQAEFNTFNAHPHTSLALPANPADNSGKANLRIEERPGTSSDGSGLYNTYSEGSKIIDPADNDIIWNAEYNRWEISFDAIGFGGFMVHTNDAALPSVGEYFVGYRQGSANKLIWKINCTNSISVLQVERSGNGTNFSSIGSITTSRAFCLQPFNFQDASPLAGDNFYRIKISANGVFHYTNTILLQTGGVLVAKLYPTIISKGGSVQVNYGGANGILTINDASGRQVYTRALANGVQSLSLPVYTGGIYFYSIKDGKNVTAHGKIVIE